MPHAALWKFLVELNGFPVSAEGSLIMRSNDHLVSPGSDGNKIFVPALCEQLLNLCLGGRRNKLLGNCRYRSMSFLCPSERLFAAKDTDRKADRDPNELLHLADYYHELTRRQSGSKRILRIALRFCESVRFYLRHTL